MLQRYFSLLLLGLLSCQNIKNPSASDGHAKVDQSSKSNQMVGYTDSDPEKFVYLLELVGLDRMYLHLHKEEDRNKMKEMGVDPNEYGNEGAVLVYFNLAPRSSSRIDGPSRQNSSTRVETRSDTRVETRSDNRIASNSTRMSSSKVDAPDRIRQDTDLKQDRIFPDRSDTTPVAVVRMNVESSEARSFSVNVRVDPELRAQIVETHDQNVDSAEIRVDQAAETVFQKDAALRSEVFSRNNEDGYSVENLIIGRGDTGFRVFEEFGLYLAHWNT